MDTLTIPYKPRVAAPGDESAPVAARAQLPWGEATSLPAWLQNLMPWIEDTATEGLWPELQRRVAGLASRWGAISEQDWARLDYGVRALCVREAMRHVPDGDLAKEMEIAARLCERAAQGAPVSDVEWRAVESVAIERTTAAWAEVHAPLSPRAQRLIRLGLWLLPGHLQADVRDATVGRLSARARVTAEAATCGGHAMSQRDPWSARAAAGAAWEASQAAREAGTSKDDARTAGDRLVVAILDLLERATP